MKGCVIKRELLHTKPGLSYSRGENGLVLATPSHPSIFGQIGTTRTRLMVAAPKSQKGVCLWIPRIYEKIEVRDKKGTQYLEQTLSLEIDANMGNQVTEADWFNLTTNDWQPDASLAGNISMVKLDEMVRNKLSFVYLGGIGISGYLAILAILGSLILGIIIWRRFEARLLQVQENNNFQMAPANGARDGEQAA